MKPIYSESHSSADKALQAIEQEIEREIQSFEAWQRREREAHRVKLQWRTVACISAVLVLNGILWYAIIRTAQWILR